MVRASLAGAILVLSASTALADPIVDGGNYFFVTTSSATEAPGTTVPPPAGGGHVGGLCNPGVGGCPTVNLGSTGGYTQGDVVLVHPTPTSSSWVIPITIPNPGVGANYLLTFLVTDDLFSHFTSNTPAPSGGDIFEVTLDGISMGHTSVVGLGGDASTGVFEAVVRGGNTYYIGITDLLQPYIGQNDTLPIALGDTCVDKNCGPVQSSAFSANIVDLIPALTPAPEPASIALVGAGLTMLGVVRRRRISERA